MQTNPNPSPAQADKPEWPRIRNLPEAERVPFNKWLIGQTVPMIEGAPMEDQDAYYPWDYQNWKRGGPITD
jgi:hypothetical protein